MTPETHIAEVLKFWFEECEPTDWFKGAHLDELICKRFGDLVRSARKGQYDEWGESANGANGSLALIILLDQFTRNIFRDSAEAFVADCKAREIARAAVDRGYDRNMTVDQRTFMYLPFEHSEDIVDQIYAVELFTEMGNERYLSYAVAHRKIIDRFGRFPHRNAVLGRANTPEEEEYLSDPDAGF